MYYNKIVGVWYLDPFDFFLISAFITSILASRLKDYISEKASMARLKNAIIKESRVIKPSKPTKATKPTKVTNFYSKESKIKRIYRFFISTRGGQVDIEDQQYQHQQYQLAEKIQDVIIKLAVFLKERELRARLLKIILTQGRLLLQLVLYRCKINLQYLVVGEVNPQIVVIACCTGGTAGFVFSWFSVGAILVTPPTILSAFLLRSLGQQILHNMEYTKLKNSIGRLLKDKTLREEIKTIFIETQKQIDNSNKIKLEYLNWNRDPAIKEAAERLGIFENAPNPTNPTVKLNLDLLDLLDADSNKILEELGELGILQNPNPIEKKIKGKTVYFRDFIDQMVDGDNKSDLDVIDAEIVKEPVRVKIIDQDL
jgi:hypothetical protein